MRFIELDIPELNFDISDPNRKIKIAYMGVSELLFLPHYEFRVGWRDSGSIKFVNAGFNVIFAKKNINMIPVCPSVIIFDDNIYNFIFNQLTQIDMSNIYIPKIYMSN